MSFTKNSILLAAALFFSVSLPAADFLKPEKVAALIKTTLKPGDPQPAYLELLSPTVKSSDIEAWYEAHGAGISDFNQKVALISLVQQKGDLASGSFFKDVLEKDPDPFAREIVARGWPYPLYKEILLPTLKRKVEDGSETVRVRMQAVETLARWGDSSGAALALKTLLSGKKAADADGQELASEALEYAGGEQDLGALEKAAKESKNAWTRIGAGRAACGIRLRLAKGDKERLALLDEAMRSKGLELRRWAASRLVENLIPGSRETLQRISGDHAHPGSGEAGEGLIELNYREFLQKRLAASKK